MIDSLDNYRMALGYFLRKTAIVLLPTRIRTCSLFCWILKEILPKRTAVYQTIGGFDIALFPCPDFLVAASYEPGTVDLFRLLIKPGMTVMDIGAHYGYFTMLSSKLVGNDGQVIAFEPEPNNHSLLLQHLDINGCKGNVAVIQAAAYDKNKMMPLYLSSYSGQHSLFIHSRRHIEVKALVLDDMLNTQKRIDFIKMDIEGGEAKALIGMERIIAGNTNLVLIVEFHPELFLLSGHNPQEFVNDLRDMDFRVYRIIEKSPVEVVPLNDEEIARYNMKSYDHNLLCIKGQDREVYGEIL